MEMVQVNGGKFAAQLPAEPSLHVAQGLVALARHAHADLDLDDRPLMKLSQAA